MKIHAPDRTYTGQSRYGETVVNFEDGVADFEGDLPTAVRQYMVGAGYTFGSKKPEPAVTNTATPPDPRDLTLQQLGTPLRDAAVDPREGDFLPPTNAGKAGQEGNPHGPNVVAPGIHAVQGPGPIVPGPVGRFEEGEDGTRVVISDTDEQQQRETTAAERVFVAREDVGTVTADLGAQVGQPAPTAPEDEPAAELKGAALDEALEDAGLPKSGTADEKRQRLAEHRGQA